MDEARVSESAQPRAAMFSMYPNEPGCILACSTLCLSAAWLQRCCSSNNNGSFVVLVGFFFFWLCLLYGS